MEAGVGDLGLQAVGKRRKADDWFVIIVAKFPSVVKALKAQWPGIEVVAPVERKMLRPRRKTSKEPLFRNTPLFLEYGAISWAAIAHDWQALWKTKDVWHVFCNEAGDPHLLRRDQLAGMNRCDSVTDWEGKDVEFLHGPMKGRTGKYKAGVVEVTFFNQPVLIAVGAFDVFDAAQ